MNSPNLHIDLDRKIQLLLKRIETLSSEIYSNATENDSLVKGKDFVTKHLIETREQLKFLSVNGKEYALHIFTGLIDYLLQIKHQVESHKRRVKNGELDKLDVGQIYAYVSELDYGSAFNYDRLEYDHNIILEPEDTSFLINNILKRYPNIKISERLPIQYIEANNQERALISEKLILLSNEAKKPKNTNEEAYIKNLVFELNMIISSIGLDEKIKKIDSNLLISEQIKNNNTLESIRKIETGYELQVQKLSKKIEDLNTYIENGFFLIISIIILKVLFFYSIKPESFFTPPDIIFSISLIVSSTAYLTYLIKERNRIIKLHDHYNIADLELKSITSYMNELTQEQRQETLIKLSVNYFKGGSYEIKNEKENMENVSDILKRVEELSKLIKDLKG
ncbi:hypothetical protein WKH78_07230 [Acinetobacter baumannii]